MTEALGWAVAAFAALQKADTNGQIRVQNTPVFVGGQQVRIARDYLGRPRLLIPASHEITAEKNLFERASQEFVALGKPKCRRCALLNLLVEPLRHCDSLELRRLVDQCEC